VNSKGRRNTSLVRVHFPPAMNELTTTSRLLALTCPRVCSLEIVDIWPLFEVRWVSSTHSEVMHLSGTTQGDLAESINMIKAHSVRPTNGGWAKYRLHLYLICKSWGL
jgi:hypothetical protein